jgi:hypothetical protein
MQMAGSTSVATRCQPLNVLADFEELDLLRTVPIRSGRERPRLP